jgi:UDP-GlcNAc:undecaprenyl-phosphate GlcNAc-1-phosphate transferase
MPTLLQLVLVPVLSAGLSLALSLYLSPIIIAAANRYGIVDKPKPPLKLHGEPVAYLGGLVVFAAFLLALAVTFPFDQRVLALLLCASLVVATGLVDDLGTLIPRDKFIGQLIAAIVLVKGGVKVDIAAFPFPADEAVSVLWMVTCMNAFNIVDVSDGLATTAGLVGSLGACVVALLDDDPMIATMSAALFGACLGFLRVNRQPARMYLGDTGSMFLGAMLGAFAMIGEYSRTNVVSAWFVPLCLCAIPLFDLALVVVARLRAGRPIYHGSPDHFAVRLRHHGKDARFSARAAGFVGAVVVATGIVSTRLDDVGASAVFGGTVVVLLALLVAILAKLPPRTAPSTPATPATPVAKVDSATSTSP